MARAKSRPRAVAVTSGKGGVGKSCVALNLALALARQEQKVLLLDADLGLGNLALLMGASPEYTIEDVLQGRCTPAAALLRGPEGIALLPAASDPATPSWESGAYDALDAGELTDLAAQYDIILVDTGAGIAPKVVDFVVAADEALLLVVPEAASIADGYAALKVFLQRRPELGAGLLVNMADSAAEAADLHGKFREIASRFLGAEIDSRGYIPLDRYVREAAKRQVPFMVAQPPTPAGEAVALLAGDLVREPGTSATQGAGFFERILSGRTYSTPLEPM
jgi:flagellar biosynthesis protein FlhG